MGGARCGSACEFCVPPMRLPRETLRELMSAVAHLVFTRKAKERRLQRLDIEITSAQAKVPLSVSVMLIGLLLQVLTSQRWEIELDHLAREYARDNKYLKVCNRVAVIISRTYIELGDGASFSDDEALLMIRDLLLGVDDTIINRNRFKRITSKDRSGFNFSDEER